MKLSYHCSTFFISSIFGLSLSSFAFAVPKGLVETLGDEDYQLREDAEKKLSTWVKGKGKETFKALEVMKEKAKSPEVKMRLDNVLDKMTIFEPIAGTRGFIGISMTARMGGAVITVVQPNTPAEKHGLQIGDEIFGLDDVDLTVKRAHNGEAMEFLRAYVKTKNAGDKLTLKLKRDGEDLVKEIKLADYDKLVPEINRNLWGQQGNFLELPPVPNGRGNLQFRMEMNEQNLEPEMLKRQLQAQERMNEQLQDMLKRAEGLQKNDKDGIMKFLELQHEAEQKKLEQMRDLLKKEVPKQPKKP